MHPLIITVLAIGCGVIQVALPVSAHRGKLHVPGYIGIGILAFIASFLFGLASGSRFLAGSPAGVALSLFCFWSAAAGVGAIVAAFFWREPAQI